MDPNRQGEDEMIVDGLDYAAPAEKSIDELLKADQEDESLQKYKSKLLGAAAQGSGKIIVDENDARIVIVKKVALQVKGRPDQEINLEKNLDDVGKKAKKIFSGIFYWRIYYHVFIFQVFTLKEGIPFQIRIDFFVQREIVSGLRYHQKTSRMGIAGIHSTLTSNTL